MEQVGKTPGVSGMDRIIKPVVVALVQLIFGMVFSVCVSLPYSSKPLGFVYKTDKLNSMNQVLKSQLNKVHQRICKEMKSCSMT